MLNLLIVVVVIAVAIWIWMTRKDEIMQLLGKREDSAPRSGTPGDDKNTAKLVGHNRPAARSDAPLEEIARKLSPLDVPMIQARYEKLGIWEHLSEHQGDMLRQTIMEHCQQGKVELWWAPLVEFARLLDYQKGEMPAIIMDASSLEALQVRKYLFALDYRLRRSGLALEDIFGADGRALEQDHKLSDGPYKVLYKVRDRAFRFPVQVQDGELDIEGLVRTVNGLCERKKAKGRFLLLPPAENLWCVVYALFTTAEQVTRSNWAHMPLPAALTEEDVERVSEELHSRVPDKDATDDGEVDGEVDSDGDGNGDGDGDSGDDTDEGPLRSPEHRAPDTAQ